ncbi:hypothetical protein ACFYUV_49820 [Nonomuraea sp. NPDC003560]|uniref:hypothetical protein n=1 Tax=Nonomuraea sp. NPDC003560 TaxID=3364341 RepID=UPI0036C5A9F3
MDWEFFRLYALVAAGLVVGIFILFAVMEATGPGVFLLLLVALGIAAASESRGKRKGGPGDEDGSSDVGGGE